MNYTVSSRGFTLIELLVVIAIIGILSAIVLVAIGNARAAGADASIKSNLRTIAIQAEKYYLDNGFSYGVQGTSTSDALMTVALCSTVSGGMWGNPTIRQAVRVAEAQGGVPATAGILGNQGINSVCGSGPNYWAIAVIMKANQTKVWCVDSFGRAKMANLSAIGNAGTEFNGCTFN